MNVRIVVSIPLELKSAIDKYTEEHDTNINDLINKYLESCVPDNTDKPKEEDVKDKEDLSNPIELVRKVNNIKQGLKCDAEDLHENINEINTILSGIEGPEVMTPDECKSKLQWLLNDSITFSKFILDDLKDLVDIIVTDKSDNLELKKVYHRNKAYYVTEETHKKEDNDDGC